MRDRREYLGLAVGVGLCGLALAFWGQTGLFVFVGLLAAVHVTFRIVMGYWLDSPWRPQVRHRRRWLERWQQRRADREARKWD